MPTASEQLIGRFMAMFGEPKTPDPDGFLVEYARAIDGTDADALRRAGDILIRKSTFWPKPSEVLDLVGEILAERDRKLAREEERKGKSLPVQMREASQMIRCDLGRRAVDEGWIRQLWDFCRTRGRLPGQYEVGALVASAREHEEIVAKLAVNPTPLQRALLNLAAGMMERGKQLAEIVDGTRDELTPINVKWG